MTGLATLKEYLLGLLREKDDELSTTAEFECAFILQILDKIDEIEENKRIEEDLLYGPKDQV